MANWGCNDELALGRETTSETEGIPGEVNLDEKVVQITAEIRIQLHLPKLVKFTLGDHSE
ncbi:Regulator of chromosome condensation [Sarracenia purpurea var. burkii]